MSELQKTEAGCKFCEKCSLMHREVDRQPNKGRKNGGKGSVALSKNSRRLGIPGFSVAEIQVDLTEEHKHKILGTEAKLVLLKRHATLRKN